MKEVADILLGSRPNLRQLCNRAFQLGSEEWTGLDRWIGLDRIGPDWKGALGSDRVAILWETVLKL